MSENNIRKATINDLEEIQKLNQLLFIKEEKEYDSTLNSDYPFEEKGVEYFKKELTEPERIVFVAKKDSSIIGYLAGRSWNEPSHKDNLKFSELQNMLVLEEYRNKKIGSQLVNQFISWSKNFGVRRIIVTAAILNTEAIRFYKKSGFKESNIKLKLDIK